MLTRRQWLQGAAASGTLLAGAGWALWPHGAPPGSDPDAAQADNYLFLNATDRRILVALLPALLGQSWPGAEEGHAEAPAVLQAIDGTVVRLQLRTADELRQLFSLLATTAGSYALLGVTDVSIAPPEELAKGLAVLQDRDIVLFRRAYAGLRDLCLGLWYGQPEHWPEAAYPGPPDLARGPRFD